MQRGREWLTALDRRARPVPVLALAVVFGLLGNTVGPVWAKLVGLGLSLALLAYGIVLARRPPRDR